MNPSHNWSTRIQYNTCRLTCCYCYSLKLNYNKVWILLLYFGLLVKFWIYVGEINFESVSNLILLIMQYIKINHLIYNFGGPLVLDPILTIKRWLVLLRVNSKIKIPLIKNLLNSQQSSPFPDAFSTTKMSFPRRVFFSLSLSFSP